ncbi:sensor histidine kinase [Mycolicibacterium monacense]|uniref:histidine kinase n=1 Tax=Mycolicibacterium monacense TaxID=85693 RepID=A0AAD1MZ57_MYCMB|nr:HAMP domain-containing sensor histidine kinase [Mycolicibacterium monacense]MDA4104423.1 ATPase [Mycolicibacterium monacense DSM 44395]ORB24516.1 two-component sensor histidine kinase [Mycolicibacterium monacense DSM 44395]QHP84038.1 HAMP domain-containing histidine kinase [Mycolicibacterium monacense DSM 44395]BBZ63248.1 two-component sensor histidine kinase [Mycolicibacterium monacense]
MWLPRLFRSTSLRTRVAVASAAAASAVVAAFTILTSVVLASNDDAQLDRRLDSIVDASMYPEQLQDPRRGVLTTGRDRSTGQVVFQRGFQLPKLPPGTETVEVNGVDYRVRTLVVDQEGGVLVSIGIRADSILLSRGRIPEYVLVGLVTVLIAGGLGWLLAGPAIRPLRKLTEQTSKLSTGTDEMPEVRGAREAEELSAAMSAMLRRLAAAQQATTNSLQAAQDFAANAAHELRTPLTAMRADLDTLRIHDLPEDERAEVVADLSRAQRRVEAIITALGQLASGQLAQAADREPIDITDTLDRVARENMRSAPQVDIQVDAEDLGTVWGLPDGLRLAVDNLVRNAITHGGAGRVVLSARRTDGWLTIVVDDDGRGLPAEEHETVLGRFRRGSTAAPGGSGLGLALVAQQAELHGGTIELADSTLGGLRATLTVSTSIEGGDPQLR